MTRNLKALGLSIVAVLAMGAVVVAPASATETNAKFTAAQYPAFYHGEEAAGNTTVTTEGGVVECKTTFTGTIQEATKTLRLTPTTTGCKAFGFLEATVSTTGCQYEYHLTTELTVAGTEDPVYQAHLDLVCEAGKAITITASTCAIEIKAQTGLTTVDFHNMTGVNPKDLTMRDTVENVAYTVSKDGFLCPFGGTGAKVGGKFAAAEAVTLRGYKDNGGVKGELINIDIC